MFPLEPAGSAALKVTAMPELRAVIVPVSLGLIVPIVKFPVLAPFGVLVMLILPSADVMFPELFTVTFPPSPPTISTSPDVAVMVPALLTVRLVAVGAAIVTADALKEVPELMVKLLVCKLNTLPEPEMVAFAVTAAELVRYALLDAVTVKVVADVALPI